jgi:UDP-glucose:(heptosyl)LPS alpha-1,3-glucosyltransferase
MPRSKTCSRIAERVRVAIVRQRYNPYGGAERFIERALPALERAGTEPTLISRSADGWGARRFVAADPFHVGRTWRDVSFARAARAAWQAGDFDLVQSHERIAGCSLYRAGDGVHAEWLDIRRAHEGAGLAIARNSAMVRGEIERRFGLAPGKLHVIHNGVDLEHFHPRHRAALRASTRAQLGTGERDFLFLFVGSGFWRKGLDAAIAALAACGDASMRLAVAGQDRDRALYAARTDAAGLGGRVYLLGGRDDVRPLYAAADCFLLPTRYDPFPNTALEALATGLPVIVGRRSGAAEIVQAGINGWVCRPEDPEELAALMRAAAAKLRDENTGRALRTAARASAENYGIDDMARRLTALYMALA